MTPTDSPDRVDGATSAEPPDGRRSRRRPLSLGCFSGLLVGAAAIAVLLGLFVVGLVWRGGQRGAVEVELARLRAAGLPTSGAELEASYVVDPGRPDVTAVWQDAIVTCRQSGVYEAEAKRRRVNGTWIALEDLSTEELRALVDDKADAFAAIERAAAAGSNVRFPTDISLGYNADVEEIQEVRQLANLHDHTIFLALREDRIDDAIAGVDRLRITGDVIGREPTAFAQRIDLTLQQYMVLRRVQDILAGEVVTSDQLDRLELIVRSLADRRGLGLAIAAERAMFLDVAEGRSGPVDIGNERGNRILTLYQTTPLVVGDEKMALEMFAALEQAVDEPAPRLLAALDSFRSRYESLVNQSYLPPVLMGSLIDGSNDTGLAFVRTEATRDLLLAGIATRRYALREGRLPRSAGELATEFPAGLPSDPFDGAPLRMMTVADSASIPQSSGQVDRLSPGPGVVVYSVGMNRVDDGGVHDIAGGMNGDLLLFLPETPDAGRLGPFPVDPATAAR